MTLDSAAIFSELTSHAKSLGIFKSVSSHEPKVAPGKGLTAAFWLAGITPTRSGLATTSVLLTFTCRIFSDMLQEPQDGIDPAILSATDKFMNSLHGDFELGGDVAFVDLLGMRGTPLSGRADYVQQDGRWYRVMDITIPVVIDDVWAQSP